MMLEGLEENLRWIKALHAADIPNEQSPACVFNPRLPEMRIPNQKNGLTLSISGENGDPGNEADVAFATVRQQGKWLREKKISALELTDIYLRRISEFDSRLLAFAFVSEDDARRQARKADDDFSKGVDRGPLQGIPYGLKDLADVEGMPTAWGAEPYRDRVGVRDASVVRRLSRAGAVLLGKTACGAIAYGDLWYRGRTRNPWNIEEGASGSSAGSASAVAAGLATFAIGTETLGSIISPSERCGTTGLRPTFGRVSRQGFMALCWSLDKVGPICRSVEDTALVLATMNGYDAADPGSSRMGFAYNGQMNVSELKVGFVPAWFEEGDSVDRDCLEAVKLLGARLVEFEPPQLDVSPLVQILLVEAAAAFSSLTLSDRDDELSWQDARAWPNSWRTARFVSAVDYLQLSRIRRQAMAEWSVALGGIDVLMGPHYAGNALLATNMCGQPQLALRAGFAQTPTRTLFDESAGGATVTHRTPRAISLWANLFQEGKALLLGSALEGALDVYRRRPPGF